MGQEIKELSDEIIVKIAKFLDIYYDILPDKSIKLLMDASDNAWFISLSNS